MLSYMLNWLKMQGKNKNKENYLINKFGSSVDCSLKLKNCFKFSVKIG